MLFRSFRESLARVEIRSIEGNTENSSGLSIYMDTSMIIIEMVILNDSRISIMMAGTGIIMTTMIPTAITASSASLFFVIVRRTPLFVFDSAIVAAIKAFSPPPYPSPVKGEGIFNSLIAHCSLLIASYTHCFFLLTFPFQLIDVSKYFCYCLVKVCRDLITDFYYLV